MQELDGGTQGDRTDIRLRIVVADGDPLARNYVSDRLRDAGGMVVIATASDGPSAVELACRRRPDVLLMEVAMPRMDGIEATRRIVSAAPGVCIVLFSANEDPEVGLRALRAGARGFLSKETGLDGIARAVRSAARGEAAISRSLAMRVIESLRATSTDGHGLRPVKSVLTAREWEVLDLLIAGATTEEAADELVLTHDTIYSHVKSINRKLGVHSRAEAVEAAKRLRSAVVAA